MKKIILLAFLVPTISLFARKIPIGRGNGFLSQVGMQGLRPGDTLTIREGTYMLGGEFRDLVGITLLNDRGIVNFGAGLRIGSLREVVFSGAGVPGLRYGLHFSRLAGNAFTVEAPCVGLKMLNCEYDSVQGTILDVSKYFITYNGNDSTLALFRTVLANQHLIRSGNFLVGSFDLIGTFHNVIDSIAFYNIIIDTTLTDGTEVSGTSIYRMSAHDWVIRGGTPNGTRDVGVFFTHGNGSVYNIYRSGGWGYLWRLWNVGLNGRAESYLYNCIDLGTVNYGTIDTRIDPSDTTTGSVKPFLRGGSMHVLNNTAGNKKDKVGYVSVLVVAGDFFPQNGYRLEVRNNLGFNNVARYSTGILQINTANPVTDTSNNLYVADAIASGILSDTVNCFVRNGSAVIDKGVPVMPVRTDIGGVSRPQFKNYDIGAREFKGHGEKIRRSDTGIPIDWSRIFRARYLAALTLLSGIFVLLFIQRARKKKPRESSRYYSSTR
ncbi:MAG: choice-of-anchor Q domain-containing protein [Puia sp.]|nr:choice-of-anchor Q domain-containing protein [Puia sp.]